MSINTANAGAKVINLGGGIVVDGCDVAGGYFVIDDLPTVQGTIPNYANKHGQLCYCTKNSKFYQYNGTTWAEANLGGDTTTIDLPISNGSASPSIQAFDGKVTDTNAKYAIAIGTNDKTPITSIVGEVVSNLITVNNPIAKGLSSTALGAGAEAISAGANALGVLNTSGVKGYYWEDLEAVTGGGYKFKLATTRKNTSISSSFTLDLAQAAVNLVISGLTLVNSTTYADLNSADFNWEVGDTLSFVNDNQFPACCTIKAIDKTTGYITVDSLPFTGSNYKPKTIANYEIYMYGPDDKTVFASYQKTEAYKSVTSDLEVSNKRWYPRNGVIELGWASTALGVENFTSGAASFVSGFNNWQAGNFGATFGRDNIGGYAGITAGMQNKSYGNHLGIIGRNITGYGEYNLLSGRDITLNSPTLTDSSHNIIGGHTIDLAKAATSAIIGSKITVTGSTGSSGLFGSTITITKGNNLGIFGYSHITKSGNCHFIAGRGNSNLGTTGGSNTILCGAYGSDSKGNTITGANSALVAGSGNTLSAASGKAAIGGLVAGLSNTVTGSSQAIVSGNLNTVDNCVNAIVSGKENNVTSVSAGLVTGYSNTVTSASYATVFGAQNTATANYVFMFGRRLKSDSTYQTIVGTNNAEVAEAPFIVGNGDTAENATPKNAFVVHKDGRATVGKAPVNAMDVATKSYVEDVLLKGEW